MSYSNQLRICNAIKYLHYLLSKFKLVLIKKDGGIHKTVCSNLA
jgi:hypothetical protein